MIISTTHSVDGHKVVRFIGMVKGNTARARIFVADWMAGLRNFVGGEVPEYTKLVAGAREQALDRMIDEARKLGANAVIGVQFSSLSVDRGTVEILAYGTAVEVA